MRRFFQVIYFMIVGFVLSSSWWVYAVEAVQEAPAEGESRGFYALAAGLAIAIAAFGGALGQSRVGAAAMEGIARNPQSQKIMFYSYDYCIGFD